MLDIERIRQMLDKISIFGGVNEEQLGYILSLLEKVSYRSDEIVFREGETPSCIYIVVSGIVKIVVDIERAPLEMITFGVGQCFGETAVIGIQPHSATAVAVEDTDLLLLPREALFSIYENDCKLFGLILLNIAREACRRLHHADETFLHYALMGRR
ncbi:MAG: cyclic nucleotide-binding domain-containing protein [Candidatus Omnitrophota bacterium]